MSSGMLVLSHLTCLKHAATSATLLLRGGHTAFSAPAHVPLMQLAETREGEEEEVVVAVLM
jgi:hypothetical protein